MQEGDQMISFFVFYNNQIRIFMKMSFGMNNNCKFNPLSAFNHDLLISHNNL